MLKPVFAVEVLLAFAFTWFPAQVANLFSPIQ